jgi:hypothetical protein
VGIISNGLQVPENPWEQRAFGPFCRKTQIVCDAPIDKTSMIPTGTFQDINSSDCFACENQWIIFLEDVLLRHNLLRRQKYGLF